MKVKYIGKTTKTDSITSVGLQWEPGQVRDVTSTVAAHLLAFKDTWVPADEESDKGVSPSQDERRVKAGDEPEPIGFLEEDKRPDEPWPVVDFHSMNKASLVEFAQEKYNVKLDKRRSEEELRQEVTELHSKHEMDDKAAR